LAKKYTRKKNSRKVPKRRSPSGRNWRVGGAVKGNYFSKCWGKSQSSGLECGEEKGGSEKGGWTGLGEKKEISDKDRKKKVKGEM